MLTLIKLAFGLFCIFLVDTTIVGLVGRGKCRGEEEIDGDGGYTGRIE